MYIGMLYNVFISLVSGSSGIIVFILLQRLRRKEKREYSQMLDYAILAFGLIWFFTALRHFFIWFNMLESDMFVSTWFVYPLSYIHLLLFFFYLTWSLFKNKGTRLVFNVIYVLITITTVLTFYIYENIPGEITYWGTEPTINIVSNNLLMYGMFPPVFIFILIDFFRRLKNWMRTKNLVDRQMLGIQGSIMVYAIISLFDGLSILSGWTLILVRIGIMMCIFSLYLFATADIKE
jgi:hypothetical protein